VATLSRRARDIIEEAFEAGADAGAASPLVTSRLHDFGFRGCTCPEQSVLGGCAHLLSFEGSDTMSAAYYAQVRGMVAGAEKGMLVQACPGAV
jgi:nicotinamide phosphoribosyltransferase